VDFAGSLAAVNHCPFDFILLKICTLSLAILSLTKLISNREEAA
jgi:hypothetical protein